MSADGTERDWLDELDPDGADLVAAALVRGLAPIAPAADGRDRLLRETGSGRLHHFAERIARLIDVTVERARTLLDRAMDASAWETTVVPGLTTFWVEGGAAVAGCIRGFIKLEAGHAFPVHKHLGDEKVLVLEGVMLDSSGQVFRPGDFVPLPAGHEHAYETVGVLDLLTFAVVREGITIGEMVVRHPD